MPLINPMTKGSSITSTLENLASAVKVLMLSCEIRHSV